MAARRLLIVMVLLLAVSTLAAALVPPPERRSGDERSQTSTREGKPRTRERAGPGRLVEANVQPPGSGGVAVERPEMIRVARGDQLALTVSTTRPAEVGVPAFGLVEFAEPGDPARLDLLVDRRGSFDVRLNGSGTVARIVSEQDRTPKRDGSPGHDG